METGKELHRFDGHEGAVYSVAFSPDGHRALSGSKDQSIRLWDVETGQELRRFDGPKSAVLGVAFSPDGHRALSGSEDKTARIWDLTSGKELFKLEDHDGNVDAVAFTPFNKKAMRLAHPPYDDEIAFSLIDLKDCIGHWHEDTKIGKETFLPRSSGSTFPRRLTATVRLLRGSPFAPHLIAA